MTRAEILRILTAALERNLDDRAETEKVVRLLAPLLQEQERRIRGRTLLLRRSGQLLEQIDQDLRGRQTGEIDDDFLGGAPHLQ